jgi:hypothetical protein
VFSHASSEKPMEFFGSYIEVTPNSRLVWTEMTKLVKLVKVGR